jgi:LysM repeat protein
MKIILTQTAIARNMTNPPAAVPTNTPPIAVQPENTEAPGSEEAPTPEPPPPTAAPLNTAVPVPSATPGHPATYVLQEGEHPYCIARRFNVDPGELLSANGLGENPLLDPGTEIKIPSTGNAWAVGTRSLLSHPSTWTVDPGDTIYYIACQYGDVDPNAIAIANGLQSPYDLTVGQVLHIP